jgi:DNA polymerase bacteriophage-type
MNFKHLFIDHESFSAADLKKQGSYRYAEDPTTEIMLTTYAFDDGPVYCYDATDGSPMPRDLRRALRLFAKGYTGDDGPRMVGANYLMFDRLLLRECWGYDITPRNIIDTMVRAFRHALPGSLAAQCEVLGVSEDLAKDKAGKALIQRFCKPTPKNYKVRRYDHTTHPQEWRQFVAYAKSDITSMREVFHRVPQWGNSAFEDEVLAVDQLINDRGFYVDTALAEAAIAAVKKHKAELQAEAAEKWGAGLTGAAFIPLLQELAPAFDIPNAQKSTLNDLLSDEDLPDDARTLIEMRLGASSTASTKYNPLLLGLSRDGRRRGCIQYGGASRTLRWAGKGFQPQNLARGYYTVDELAIAIPVMLKGRAHWLYDVSKLTASTVRGCIVPTPGNKLVVADYSNVEGRGLAWLAGEGEALATFRAGTDIYKVLASTMFKVSYDDVTKDQRQIAKAAVLGLGYGGGVNAFLTFAKNLGLDLHKLADDMDGSFPDHIWAAARKGFEYARIQEKNKRGFAGKKPERPSYDLPKKVWLTCDSIKRMYREANPAIARFWRELDDGVMLAVKTPGKVYWAGAPVRANGDKAIKITRTFTRDDEGKRVPGWCLKLELPSGRVLSYPGVGISVEKVIDEDDAERPEYRERVRYMGQNQTTRQWQKIYTYGGKLAENCISGDMKILQEGIGLVRLDQANPDLRVWDGVEFVKFDKLVYKGKQTVTSRYGVTMTHDHKVLTEYGWKTASQSEGLDRAKVGLPDGYSLDWS